MAPSSLPVFSSRSTERKCSLNLLYYQRASSTTLIRLPLPKKLTWRRTIILLPSRLRASRTTKMPMPMPMPQMMLRLPLPTRNPRNMRSPKRKELPRLPSPRKRRKRSKLSKPSRRQSWLCRWPRRTCRRRMLPWTYHRRSARNL